MAITKIIPGKPQPVDPLWALIGTWGGDAQMGSGLDHETPFYLEIGPITIYIFSWNMRIRDTCKERANKIKDFRVEVQKPKSGPTAKRYLF